MIEVKELLEVFEKLLSAGASLDEYVVVDSSDGLMPKDTKFIVMLKKDLPNENIFN